MWASSFYFEPDFGESRHTALHTRLIFLLTTCHHSCLPLPPPHTPPLPLKQTSSERRGAWEVQPSRQGNSSYLSSHLAADRHGGSVQVVSSTNGELNADEPVHSNAPITAHTEVEVVDEANCVKMLNLWCCCFFKRKRKKSSPRHK
ncbi:unnamed protein product [Knipowitschia caucasica]